MIIKFDLFAKQGDASNKTDNKNADTKQHWNAIQKLIKATFPLVCSRIVNFELQSVIKWCIASRTSNCFLYSLCQRIAKTRANKINVSFSDGKNNASMQIVASSTLNSNKSVCGAKATATKLHIYKIAKFQLLNFPIGATIPIHNPCKWFSALLPQLELDCSWVEMLSL